MRPLGWVVSCLVVVMATACADDAATGPVAEPEVEVDGTGIELRRSIGPRAVDADRAVSMIVDSIDVSGDDIFLGIRVVNGTDELLDLGIEEALFGSPLSIRDDLGNSYPADSVEPGGVEPRSVGMLTFRLAGPFDPEAEEFSVELATRRGPLTSEPIAAPDGGGVRWQRESAPLTAPESFVAQEGDRSIRVVAVADRGTNLDVSITARDTGSGFTLPSDAAAALTFPDGTEVAALAPAPTEERSAGSFDTVLRFPATPAIGSSVITLEVAGLAVEMPMELAEPSATDEPPLADLARLPDLLHLKATTEPLPASGLTIDPG